jgi:hypothetical protein
MGVLVFFMVPETKGKTLERMDDVFGTAYGDAVEVELGNYRRDRREKGGFGKQSGVLDVEMEDSNMVVGLEPVEH